MTPKEKAKELIDKMYHYQWREKQRAKECALIAVDELINYTKQMIMVYDLSFDISDSYWTQVKQELEKL